jgi:endoglucanase
MRTFNLIIIFLSMLSVALNACKSEDKVTPTPPVASSLTALDLEVGGSVFNTVITGKNITLKRELPFATENATIKKLMFSGTTSCSKKVGDVIEVSDAPVSIVIKDETTKEEIEYTLTLTTRDFPSIVEKNGLLKTSGSKIVNKDGHAVSFAGNSFFWSNNGWGGERYYKSSVVSWLALDWETTIVRAAMGVDESGGYLADKTANINRVKTIVDAAIDEGLYVLIDWHSHHAEDYETEAIEFFKEMATTYGSYDNVIYEIYNEPLNISWSDKLKPYAENVIAAIREIDADNMIVVGTPEWSQRVDLAAADPITSSTNIAYTLHFYTVYHKQWLRDRATSALNSGIALFVTEWGSIGYTQTDPETDLWMTWCKTNNISHCNWSVNDKTEEWSIVKPGANTSGGWSDSDLTEAGKLSRNIIRSW